MALGLWPWPTRTPLNARVHGTVERDDYVVDKLVFESVPGHVVTGSLYRPKNTSPAGARPCSPRTATGPGGRFHDAGEKDAREAIASGAEPFESAARHPLQARAVHLARMGVVTFLYDMEGYADSVQIPRAVAHELKAARPQMHDRTRMGSLSARRPSCTSRASWGCKPGTPSARSTTCWAATTWTPRAVGVTGASGGATQTMMVAALDDRPAAFFPAVMVSTHMQGGCTCENASYLRIGTGNAEIASLAAPKPLAMTAANDWTKEFATDGYPDVQRVFALTGAPDHVQLRSFVQFEHNYNAVARAVMYDWFNRHLRLGFTETPKERPFVPLTRRRRASGTTRIPNRQSGEPHERALLKWMTQDAAAAIAALVPTALARSLRDRRGRRVRGDPRRPRRLTVTRCASRRAPRSGSVSDAITPGVLRRASNGAALPALLVSRGRPKGVAVWVSPEGKSSLLSRSGSWSSPAERLLSAGYELLAIDVLGQGELRTPDVSFDTVRLASERAHAGFTYGYNLPLPAQRVQDVLTAIRVARSRAGSQRGACCSWAPGPRRHGPRGRVRSRAPKWIARAGCEGVPLRRSRPDRLSRLPAGSGQVRRCAGAARHSRHPVTCGCATKAAHRATSTRSGAPMGLNQPDSPWPDLTPAWRMLCRGSSSEVRSRRQSEAFR